MNNHQTQATALPVIITLANAKASVLCQPQHLSVIIIDLDQLNETSNSALALDLIDTIRATTLDTDQIETVVAQITEAAQYTCTRCDTPTLLAKTDQHRLAQCTMSALTNTSRKALKNFNSLHDNTSDNTQPYQMN